MRRMPLVLTIVGAALTVLAVGFLGTEIVLSVQGHNGSFAWLPITLAALSLVGTGLVLSVGVTQLRAQRRRAREPMAGAGAQGTAALTPVLPSQTLRTTTSRTATVALVVAIVGFVLKAFPIIGDVIGGPENVAAVVLGIIGLVIAIRRGTGKRLAIAAIILGFTPLAGTFFGEGSLW